MNQERNKARVDKMLVDAHRSGWDIYSPDEKALLAEVVALRTAAQAVLGDFERITQHQHRLLTEGQTFESASRNWDEATLWQSIDFQPLIDVLGSRG